MVAFVKDFPGRCPSGLFDPATALPVQVYNFTQRADPAFVERASGAIIVLLVFLVVMNTIAIVLRQQARAPLVGPMRRTTAYVNDMASTHGASDARLADHATRRTKVTRARRLRLLRREAGALRRRPRHPEQPGDRAYRPVGLRQVDLPALHQPDERHHPDRAASTGAITLDDEDIYDPRIDVVELRARVGMVFQKPNPFPKSIFENVAYGPRIHGMTRNKAELEAMVDDARSSAPASGTRSRTACTSPAPASPAASSSGSASPAPSPPGPRCC